MLLATAISRVRQVGFLLGTLIVIAGASGALAQQIDPGKVARRTYWVALAAYQSKTNDLQTTWQFGRACFDLGEFATNSTERAAVAEEGIAATRKAVALDEQCAAGHYYLGMNLGQLARTRGIGALKLVTQMEKEFLRAAELDPHFEHAGPDRTLGVLYRDAPSIASIGNRLKSKHHLDKAVELAPDYPENHIALIEAALMWHDRNTALRETKVLEQLLPEARKNFSGPSWTASWLDWDTRIAAIRKKMEPEKALSAPRQKG